MNAVKSGGLNVHNLLLLSVKLTLILILFHSREVMMTATVWLRMSRDKNNPRLKMQQY
jgi:hypothetical protein